MHTMAQGPAAPAAPGVCFVPIEDRELVIDYIVRVRKDLPEGLSMALRRSINEFLQDN
jgi:hypothetical protein